MRKAALVAALAFLIVASTLFGKARKYLFFPPHPTAEQNCTDLYGHAVDRGPGIAQHDDEVNVVVEMLPLGNTRLVRIFVSIFNKGSSPTLLFTPNTAFVTLPNGHSYAPYTQTDAIEALVRSASASGNSNAGYIPPRDTLKTVCTTNGSTINCTSTVDSKQRQAYDLGYGIGTALSEAIDAHRLNKEVKAIQDHYLASREIDEGKALDGYMDVYVEDHGGGPFKLTLPIGSKIYMFMFGPTATNEQWPK